MKKIILAVVALFAVGGYVVWSSKTAPAPVAATPTTTDTNPADTTKTTGTPSTPTPTPTPAPTPTPTPVGMYKDGTYTGAAVNAYYGMMQVAAVIKGGKLVDVQMLQYPKDRGETARISSTALPILRQEAITSQSAKVSAISGATQTVDGFVETLKSALAQAKA